MSNAGTLPRETSRLVGRTCLCLHTQRAARALARRFDAIFRPLGLTNGQFSLLMALNRPEPLPVGALADILAMDRTTVTAMLKPLVRRGLVELRPDDTDRRRRGAAMTDAGRALLADAYPLWERGHAELEHEIARAAPDVDTDALRRGLRALS